MSHLQTSHFYNIISYFLCRCASAERRLLPREPPRAEHPDGRRLVSNLARAGKIYALLCFSGDIENINEADHVSVAFCFFCTFLVSIRSSWCYKLICISHSDDSDSDDDKPKKGSAGKAPAASVAAPSKVKGPVNAAEVAAQKEAALSAAALAAKKKAAALAEDTPKTDGPPKIKKQARALKEALKARAAMENDPLKQLIELFESEGYFGKDAVETAEAELERRHRRQLELNQSSGKFYRLLFFVPPSVSAYCSFKSHSFNIYDSYDD